MRQRSFSLRALLGTRPLAFGLALGVIVNLACVRSASGQAPYDLTQLRVVGNVLSRVRTRYVDPRKLDPKEMLRKALQQIQEEVPEVIVRLRPADVVEVQVDAAKRSFSYADVDSPWALTTALRGIFRFIQDNLHPTTKRPEVEYAAVDGILKTLDCHSNLLRPKFFDEMQIHTRGSFGGLGITISRCGHPQMLTIVKPMAGTPAAKAGLKAGDEILKIDDQPTVNLGLNEAVNLMRGTPGSTVVLHIRRKGEFPLRRFPIERAEIQIRAVDYQLLAGKVGYIRLKNFQNSTDVELKAALTSLQAQGMVALILDLRGNGGGLLGKAIAVADAFVYSGTLVTTVEHGTKRRESRATWGATLEGKAPMAVLVDPGTASASEIVAGALKNLDRAVIIGQRTYGKGSVQVIYPNTDGSGFKVTIAQYLTPGDRSIQGVGVIPDIETAPVEVRKDRVNYFGVGADLVREGDRACSLDRASLALLTPPQYRVHHLSDDVPRGFRCEPCGVGPEWEVPPDPDQFALDYPIRLASQVVLATRSADRRRVLEGARAILARAKVEQTDLIGQRLRATLGLDWSAAPAGAARPKIDGSVTVGEGGYVDAGRSLVLNLTVANAPGAGPAHRVRGLVYSSNPAYQHREIFVGKVAPGERRTATLTVKLPKGLEARADDLSVRLFADETALGATPCVVFRHRAVAPAEFTYTRQLLDLPPGGNGDGRLQGGETVTLRVQVRNTGKGAAGESYLRLKNESGEAVDVKKGIFDLTGLKPGAVATYDLQFKVSARPGVGLAKLQLSVGDCEVGPSVSEKLRFAVVAPEGPLTGLKGVAVPKTARTEVFQSAVADHVLGHGAAGARFAVTGRVTLAGAAFLRVTLPGGGSGFVREADVTLLRGGAAAPRLDWRWLPAPPTLTVDPVPDVVAGPTMTLKGEARDADRVSDVYVSVRRILRSPDQSRLIGTDFSKVYYQATRSLTAKQLAFTTDVPLWPGSNLVTIVVRKNDEIKTRRTFRVLRTTCGSAAAAPTR